jgi:hypothetical protein
LHCGEAIADTLAWQRLIDLALPDIWNFECDIFAVHGTPPVELIAALRERGQRRIINLAPVPTTVSSDSTPGTNPGFFLGNEPAALFAFVEGLGQPYPRNFAKMHAQRGVKTDGIVCDAELALQAALEEVICKSMMSNWVNHNTRRLFAQRWVQQTVENIPAIACHANLHRLDGCFRDRPAILISPGPSLEKNVEQLRRAKDKAVLIAPLQSLRRLFKAGIRPDFVTVLDAADLTSAPLDFFGDVPDEFLSTLVVAVNCHPSVIRRFQKVVFFSGGGPLDSWVQSIVPEPLLELRATSVALANLLLARHWGCNPITLVGQDLALAGNRRYAGDDQVNNLNAPHLKTLPGYYGGTVQSPSDYFLFHYQFEKIAEEIALLSPETQLFNATEGGAFIQGFAHEPLHTVLEQHVVSLPQQPVTNLLVGDQNLAQSRLNTARERLQNTCKVLEDLQQQVRQLVRLSQQPRPQAATLRKLSEKEQMLRKTLKRIEGFTSIYQDDIDHAVAASAQAKTLHDNLVASQALYQVVAESCQFFCPLVEDALAVLQAIDPPSSSAEAGQKKVALPV